jgi:hypothetical protein
MKHKLKNKEKEKEDVGTHLAACHPVPSPVCGCLWPLCRAQPFRMASTPHDMKDKLKIKEKGKKKRCGRAPSSPSPRSQSCSSPFVPVVPCMAVWDGVNAFMI